MYWFSMASSLAGLVFGPPGTGKTTIAKAISSNIEATFFNVTLSELLFPDFYYIIVFAAVPSGKGDNGLIGKMETEFRGRIEALISKSNVKWSEIGGLDQIFIISLYLLLYF